jgi:type IV secretory pathway VirB3-like protein
MLNLRVSNVNRAITLPRLSNGVSTAALGICWGPAAFVGVMIGTSIGWIYALIPIAIGAIVHSVLRWAFAKDHRIFEIYAKYSIIADEYHPHVRETLPIPFERPIKVGKGVRI